MPQQRFIGGAQLLQRVHRAALDLQFADGQAGAHHQGLGVGRGRFGQLQRGCLRAIGIHRQVGRGQRLQGFVAVEIAWKRFGTHARGQGQ